MGREFASPGTSLQVQSPTDPNACAWNIPSLSKAAFASFDSLGLHGELTGRLLGLPHRPPRISLRPATRVAPTVGKEPTAAVLELLTHPHVCSSAFSELLVQSALPALGLKRREHLHRCGGQSAAGDAVV